MIHLPAERPGRNVAPRSRRDLPGVTRRPLFRRICMTGMFELFIDEDTSFRFRLKAPDGTVVAVSKSFPDKRAAVSGISDVREYAGMGLITDLCPEVPLRGPAPTPPVPVAR